MIVPHNHLFCWQCNEYFHEDSFSAAQKRVAKACPQEGIYCLRHTSSSAFNSSYKKAPRPTKIQDSESEELESNHGEDLRHSNTRKPGRPMKKKQLDSESEELESDHGEDLRHSSMRCIDFLED